MPRIQRLSLGFIKSVKGHNFVKKAWQSYVPWSDCSPYNGEQVFEVWEDGFNSTRLKFVEAADAHDTKTMTIARLFSKASLMTEFVASISSFQFSSNWRSQHFLKQG